MVKIYENQQKGTEKGGATYAKAYVGRPISAHHDTPLALSAVDVAGFMVIDSAYSTKLLRLYYILYILILYAESITIN